MKFSLTLNEHRVIKSVMRLWTHFDKNRRKQIYMLMVLMIFASIFEVMSLGVVVPFLGILTAPQKIITSSLFLWLTKLFPWLNDANALFFITLVFCIFAFLAGSTRLLLMWFQTRFSHAIGADIGYRIYERALFQPYSVHVSRNSAEVVSGILNKANGLVTFVVMPVLVLVSSALMIIFIMGTIILVNPYVALATFGGFGLLYTVVMAFARTQLTIDGDRINRQSTSVIKVLQEGLGGIRDVLLDGTQKTFLSLYLKADKPLRAAQANVQIIGSAPRFIIEAIGLIFIGLIAFYLSNNNQGILGAIPLLGLVALGAQRLLPLMQQVYICFVNLRAGTPLLKDVLDLLGSSTTRSYFELQDFAPIKFSKHIELKGISFHYMGSNKEIFSNLNLKISKGSRIGIVGPTGCGKSTLCDILMGLLSPDRGCLVVDDQVVKSESLGSWQRHIAHVPQSIFLTDSSVAENIAFGIDASKIDYERLIDSAKKAGIHNDIEGLSLGYKTKIGERGVQLSGGQRQRIGIARALYKNAEVIFLDEATSALDSRTERAVVDAVNSLSRDLTIITVAHRTTTLSNCDAIIELINGSIGRIGTYEDILGKVN